MSNLIIKTNKYLTNKKKRQELIFKSVLSSFRIEGIHIKKSVARKIADKVDAQFKKSS